MKEETMPYSVYNLTNFSKEAPHLYRWGDDVTCNGLDLNIISFHFYKRNVERRDFMTYEELKKKHSLNSYNKFKCAEILKSYPYLLHFGTSKRYLYYDDIARLTFVSFSFAKSNKISVYPHVIGFFHTHYGCYPLFVVTCNKQANE